MENPVNLKKISLFDKGTLDIKIVDILGLFVWFLLSRFICTQVESIVDVCLTCALIGDGLQKLSLPLQGRGELSFNSRNAGVSSLVFYMLT